MIDYLTSDVPIMVAIGVLVVVSVIALYWDNE